MSRVFLRGAGRGGFTNGRSGGRRKPPILVGLSCYAVVLSWGIMTSSPNSIRVAIVEDQREVREGLALLIGRTEGYQCRGAFGSIEEALIQLDRAHPDGVLVDIGLPGMSGIEGIRHMKTVCPQAQFLVLTVYDDDRRIFEAMCAGACGYLLKKTPPPRILEALREVHAGGAPMSPE